LGGQESTLIFFAGEKEKPSGGSYDWTSKNAQREVCDAVLLLASYSETKGGGQRLRIVASLCGKSHGRRGRGKEGTPRIRRRKKREKKKTSLRGNAAQRG